MLHTHDIHERMQNAAIFGIAFAVVGYLVPNLFFMLMPASYFFNVEQPVEVNQPVYAKCEDIQITLNRHSRIDAQAVSRLELSLIYEDGAIEDVVQRTKDINITIGDERIKSNWQIPCNALTGQYYITGVIDFDAGHQQKTYAFTTEYFLVE